MKIVYDYICLNNLQHCIFYKLENLSYKCIKFDTVQKEKTKLEYTMFFFLI